MKTGGIVSAVLAGCGLILCLCGAAPRSASSPSEPAEAQPRRAPTVRTNFEANARLTGSEVREVVSLAKLCGIREPGEVSTFWYIPGGGRGVLVQSVERVKDRDVFVDQLPVGKVGWTDGTPEKGAKSVGKFWAESSKWTRHYRICDFRGNSIRVQITKGVTSELADTVIPLVAARKVRLGSKTDLLNLDTDEMAKMIERKPTALSKQENGALWLYVEGDSDALEFRLEKGMIVPQHLIRICY